MRSPPIGQAETEARISGHADELLKLWWAEQGPSKPRDLDLIASVIPFPRDEAIGMLDLCCGPGDVGRAVRRIYPNARIDCVDRDPFLASICKVVNQQAQTPARLIIRDLSTDGWLTDLPGDYHVVATVNSLHWFDVVSAQQLIKDVYSLLRGDGIFLFAEPTSPERPLAPGFEDWKARQPPRYLRENWQRFWARANALLGYDHTALLGPRDRVRLDDDMSVAGWINLLRVAGFRLVDVLLRDADQVIIGALKSSS